MTVLRCCFPITESFGKGMFTIGCEEIHLLMLKDARGWKTMIFFTDYINNIVCNDGRKPQKEGMMNMKKISVLMLIVFSTSR
jgi:hypothetical protein